MQSRPHDLVVKFAIPDGRDRAGREFGALSPLRQAGLCIAPRPVLLDRDAYELPVVVQTYLPGEVSVAPPPDDEEWLRLLEHLLAAQSVTPDRASVALPLALAAARERRASSATRVGTGAAATGEARPYSLRALLERLEAAVLPVWPAPGQALRRADPDITNFVRRPGP